jgi:hypothetical protein
MNALQKTLAIVALLFLTGQTVRHAYVLWIEPRGSVLDKYDQPLKDQISAATSLDELLRSYDRVYKEVERAKQEATKAGKETSYRDETESEPYKSEHALREAITGWEAKSKEIHGIRFYWFIGLGFFVLGLLMYKKLNRWFGLTFLIAAFSEHIYWTSPTFLGRDTSEFDRLIENKLAFSVVSLALLIGAIWFLSIFADKTEQV